MKLKEAWAKYPVNCGKTCRWRWERTGYQKYVRRSKEAAQKVTPAETAVRILKITYPVAVTNLQRKAPSRQAANS